MSLGFESSSLSEFGSDDSSSEYWWTDNDSTYSSESSDIDFYNSPSEDDDTLDADGKRNAKRLSDLSRSIVGRNVDRENVGELPLPRRLKKEIFKNLLTDRHGPQKKVYGRSLSWCWCDCIEFCSETCKSKWNEIPDWSERAESHCGVRLLYDESAFPSDAPWLKLPDREGLLDDLKDSNDDRIALLNPLRFDRRSGLGEVHVWLKRFVFYRTEYDWFFLVVAAGCIKSFKSVAELSDLVVLPYSCVSDHGAWFEDAERFRIKSHRRCMIVVVRDGRRFRWLLERRLEFGTLTDDVKKEKREYDVFGWPKYRKSSLEYVGDRYRCSRISKVTNLVKAIAYVSKPKHEDSKFYKDRDGFQAFRETHYFFTNPIVAHGEWWMLLLASFGGFDAMAKDRVNSLSNMSLTYGKKIDGRRYVSASVALNVENCAVRFDPPDICIGDPVRENETIDYLRGGKPFVFGFDNRILSTFRTDDCPTADLKKYGDWCVSNEINTLLHFDRKDVVEYGGRREKIKRRQRKIFKR